MDYNNIPGINLSEDQIEGIKFALDRKVSIIGYGVGNGKTLLALSASMHMMKDKKNSITFILCPKIANPSFFKELKLTGEVYSIITTDVKAIKNGSRFFLFNYSNVSKLIAYALKLKSMGYSLNLIADEIHTLQNPTSGVSRSVKSIIHVFDRIIGLTGTILLNDLLGTYHMIELFSPGYLGKLIDFKSNFMQIKPKTVYVKGGRKRNIEEIVGYKNLDALKAKLEGLCIVRKKEYNVNFIYKVAKLTEEEQEIYTQASDGILEGNEKDDDNMASRLHDLQRVADGSLENLDINDIPTKIKLLLSTIRDIMQRGEGTLIYTEYEDTYSAIHTILKKYKAYLGYNNIYMITGKIEQKDRIKVQSNLKAKDIVIITRAGAQSVNLQAVNNIILYNIPFSTGWVIQAIGRVARMDSKYESQNVYVLEIKDSIDTYKRLLLQANAEAIKQIFGREWTLPDVDKPVDVKKFRSFFKRKLLWSK